MLVVSWLLGCASEAPPSPPPPRGVVLVSLDTVRFDRTSFGGAPTSATPSLARFAEDAVVFDHAYAPANETLFSHGAVFTGAAASRVAPVDYDFTIPDGTPTIASRMRDAGYRTGAIVSGGHLARVFGVDDGFETYTESGSWGSFRESVPVALRWLDQVIASGEPFFLFVHGYDAHAPYIKPGYFARLGAPGRTTPLWSRMFDPLFYERIYERRVYDDFPLGGKPNARGTEILELDLYRRLPQYASTPGVASTPLTDDDLAVLQGAYASAVLYADLWTGVLLQELDARGLGATTTVAIMSDHGEAMLDHGFVNHRHTVRDVSTRVPLAIRPAGGHAPTIVSTPVSLLDLAPTLLELAGTTSAPTMTGRSLVPCFGGDCPLAGLPYSEGALGDVTVTDGAHRLVVSGMRPEDPALDAAIPSGEGVTTLLYDASDGERVDHAADPARQADVARLRAALLAARRGPS